MKKAIIVYHYEDNDGCLSGAMMYGHLMNLGMKNGGEKREIDTLPANYNKLSEMFKTKKDVDEYFSKYDEIVFTDISFNDPQFMLEVKKLGKHFVWVDHHKPIIDASRKLGFDDVDGVRDTSRSAILNMYKYLYDPFDGDYISGKVPPLFRFLSAYDSWTWENEGLDFDHCRWVNQGVNVEFDLDFMKFVNQIEDFFLCNTSSPLFKDLFDKGRDSIIKKDIENEKFVERCGELGWTVNGNQSAVAVVTSGPTNSLVFQSLKGKVQNAIAFKREANGNWIISLYNIDDNTNFHCGEYLKEKYGGGGHKGAAGCTIKDFNVINTMFVTKSI